MTVNEERSRPQKLSPMQLTKTATSIRSLAKSANTMEELAGSLTNLIFDRLRTPSGSHACALVRFFRTVRFCELNAELQHKASKSYGQLAPDVKFLTLLGTTGSEPQWNKRQSSSGHQLIPLFSADMVARAPMIARLFNQLGVNISSLLDSGPNQLEFVDPADREYNIFFVQNAKNSPFIPSQEEFVEPHKIGSVVGYGSLLPDGEFYTVVMFFKTILLSEIQKGFSSLALSSTIACLSLPADRPLFITT